MHRDFVRAPSNVYTSGLEPSYCNCTYSKRRWAIFQAGVGLSESENYSTISKKFLPKTAQQPLKIVGYLKL